MSVNHPHKRESAKTIPGSKEKPVRVDDATIFKQQLLHHDILTIRPQSYKAKVAFDQLLYMKEQAELQTHHGRFLVSTGREQITEKPHFTDEARSPNETSDDQADTHSTKPPESIQIGYYRINYDCLSRLGPDTWALGRGSAKKKGPERGIDILLAVPDKRSLGDMRSIHLLLRMHPASGVWMIRPNFPVEVDGVTIDPKTVAVVPLTRSRVSVAIDEMKYSFQFEINTPQLEKAYKERRDSLLRHYKVNVPDTSISGIPFDCDSRLPSAVFRHGIGSGTFATVYEGVDPQSGDLRVVKRIEIKKEFQRQEIEAEIRALKECHGSRGIVTLYEVANSVGGGSTDGPLPLNIFLVQEKGRVWWKVDWAVIDWPTRLSLFCQLLEGLRAIHQKSWIHCDISVNNLLLIPTNPLQAAICDFGKVNFNPTSQDPHVGGGAYRAPEIRPDASYTYDQRIDVWMLGWAMYMTWFRDLIHHHQATNGKNIDLLRHALRASHHGNDSMADLLNQMIVSTPAQRPTAERCLMHLCFRPLQHE